MRSGFSWGCWDYESVVCVCGGKGLSLETYCWWAFAAPFAVLVVQMADAVDVLAVPADDFGESGEQDGSLKAQFADSSLGADDAFTGCVVLRFDLD